MFKFLFVFLLLLSCAGDRLPKLPVKTLDNRTVYLSDYKGRKLLLYVWSRTCAGHSRDLRELSKLAQNKDYMVISYALAMTPEDVIKSYRELGIKDNFITLVDIEVKFNDHYPITFLPSTYIFDEKGKLIKSYPGLYKP
ncbi:MAG: TlpA family protein disulfide reductase [Aquificaceae bacterium]|nr:TlpA family protein disulfide reductase [Aquificaceae bacterium]